MREAGMEEVQEDINQISNLAKPLDLKKELRKELDQVDTELKAWTSKDFLIKEDEKVEKDPSEPTEPDLTESI